MELEAGLERALLVKIEICLGGRDQRLGVDPYSRIRIRTSPLYMVTIADGWLTNLN